MAQGLLYRQKDIFFIDLGVLDSKKIKQRIGNNLRRIRMSRGLTQDDVGAMCDPQVNGSHIGAIEAGGGLRVDMLSRLCKALEIDPSELYLPENPPYPKDTAEKLQLDLYREETRLGIAEEVREMQELYIERAKKKTATGGEGAPRQIQRKTRRPIPIDFNKEEREALRLYEKAEDLGVAHKLDQYAARLIAEAGTQSGRGKKRSKIGHKK